MIDSVIVFVDRQVVERHYGVTRMHGRHDHFRLGQLLATLIHNAVAELQPAEPHPIALVITPFRRALIPCPGPLHRRLSRDALAGLVTVRVPPIVLHTDSEGPQTSSAGAHQKNAGHVLADGAENLTFFASHPKVRTVRVLA
jgi:hypothetical protein